MSVDIDSMIPSSSEGGPASIGSVVMFIVGTVPLVGDMNGTKARGSPLWMIDIPCSLVFPITADESSDTSMICPIEIRTSPAPASGSYRNRSGNRDVNCP